MLVTVTIDVPETFMATINQIVEMTDLSMTEVVQRVTNLVAASMRDGKEISDVLTGTTAVFAMFPEVAAKYPKEMAEFVNTMPVHEGFDFRKLLRKALSSDRLRVTMMPTSMAPDWKKAATAERSRSKV
jgi:hypothetical protein